MRAIVPFGLMAILLMFLAAPVQAQGVTGDWTITYSQMGRQGGEAREISMEVTFLQDEATVTGTAMMAMGGRGRGGGGGDPPAPQEIAIEDGTMEGDVLTFTINRGMGERTMSMVFTGTVAGNEMKGTLAMSGGMGGGEPIPFQGVKKEG
jgi:hypothetical protein